MAPAKLERCVSKVEKTIKPRKAGQSKRSAAFGVCTVATKAGRHKAVRGRGHGNE